MFQDYRREYKNRFARMKAGKLEPEELYAWDERAREKKSGVRSGEAVPGRLRCLAAGIMIKKEKLSGADCMQSTPFSFRYEPIFLQKMGYKRTSSQGIRPDVEMLGADTAIEAKSIHDGVLQNFYDSIFCASPCPSFLLEKFSLSRFVVLNTFCSL